MNTFAQILWYTIPITPLITIGLLWKFSKWKWYIYIPLGLLLGFGIATIFYFISLGIIFSNGMGPS